VNQLSFSPLFRTWNPPSPSSTLLEPIKPNTDCCTQLPPLRFTSTTFLFIYLAKDCSNIVLEPRVSITPPLRIVSSAL
jgi:hypothetical protein